jgi:hypothetical protein
MQIGGTAAPWLTIGAIIAVVVLLIAILGLLSVVPLSNTVVFGLIAALAVARLV